MNILKRLNRLSVDDLQDLQTAILGEIQRRAECGAGSPSTHGPLKAIVGEIQRRRGLAGVAGSGIDGSLEGGRSAAVSKPAPVSARPVSPRRAA
jgi:hypothetical protein